MWQYKFEITKNVQWPRSFSEIEMKLIQNHLHWRGDTFQKIPCWFRRWTQRFSNFNNAQFLLFESIYDKSSMNHFIVQDFIPRHTKYLSAVQCLQLYHISYIANDLKCLHYI